MDGLSNVTWASRRARYHSHGRDAHVTFAGLQLRLIHEPSLDDLPIPHHADEDLRSRLNSIEDVAEIIKRRNAKTSDLKDHIAGPQTDPLADAAAIDGNNPNSIRNV